MTEFSIKSKLLLLYKNGDDIWDYDAVQRVLMDVGKDANGIWKWYCRTYLIEMQTNALLVETDYALDDGSHFEEGKVLKRYRITDFGKRTVHSMLER